QRDDPPPCYRMKPTGGNNQHTWHPSDRLDCGNGLGGLEQDGSGIGMDLGKGNGRWSVIGLFPLPGGVEFIGFSRIVLSLGQATGKSQVTKNSRNTKQTTQEGDDFCLLLDFKLAPLNF
ncbi:MAG: hypothetical protein NTV46_01560, partial [Verrucomicrobia bacterium]|nr:hypothetical protein [Verrucomicrobiota bacterium]